MRQGGGRGGGLFKGKDLARHYLVSQREEGQRVSQGKARKGTVNPDLVSKFEAAIIQWLSPSSDAWLSPGTESGTGDLILVAAVLPLLLVLVVQRRASLGIGKSHVA